MTAEIAPGRRLGVGVPLRRRRVATAFVAAAAAFAAAPGMQARQAPGWYIAATGATAIVWGGNGAGTPTNGDGELGNGSTVTTKVPSAVANLGVVTQVSAGTFHTLFLLADTSVWATGYGADGELGQNNAASSLVPLEVHGPLNFGFITGIVKVVGCATWSAAIKSDGTVWEWGGVVGGSLVPVQVAGLTNVAQIACGDDVGIALESNNTVWAWGGNSHGALGNGTCCTANATAVQVLTGSGLTTAIAVGASRDAGYAIKSDGTVWSWGRNLFGQLGNGTCCTDTSTPAQIPGLSGMTALATNSNDYAELALKSDGTVWAWGRNLDGELGDNTFTQHNTPIEVHGPANLGFLTGITGVAINGAGDGHSIAVKNDGTTWAWGSNGSYSYAGDLAGSTSPTPVQSTIRNATQVSAGGYFNTAIGFVSTGVQIMTMTTGLTGTLSITPPGLINLGAAIVAGSTISSFSLGSVSWTDTLNDAAASSVTIGASDLYSSPTKLILFTAFSFGAGAVSSALPSNTGSTPTAGAAGALTGADGSPGTTQSAPVTLANGSSTTEGTWTQTNTISMGVPANIINSGVMTSTLVYTVIG